MKLLLSTLLAAALTLSACAGYHVKPEETTVKQVMDRWAAEHDKSLKWDIEDLAIAEPEALNDLLSPAQSLSEAVAVFLNVAEKGRLRLAAADGQPRPDPIMACIYDNAILVAYHRGAALACSKTVLPQNN